MRAVLFLSLSATAISRVGFVVAHELNTNVQNAPQSLPNQALEAESLTSKPQFNTLAAVSPPESIDPSRFARKRSQPDPTSSVQLASSPQPVQGPQSKDTEKDTEAQAKALSAPSAQSSEALDLPWENIVARSLGADPNVLPANVRSKIAAEVALSSTSPAPRHEPIELQEAAQGSGSIEHPGRTVQRSRADGSTNGGTVPRNRPVVLSQVPSNPAAAGSMSPVSVDETYTLGPGDGISVSFFNVPEYSGQYQVLVDGTLNMPVVGSISVKGMTLREAGDAIAARYISELRHPRVTLSLVSARPLQVGILGEVGQPGLYTLSLTGGAQFPTLTQIIQVAGGATQAANLRQIEVRRANRSGSPQVIAVNLWEFLQNGDLSQNLSLRDGDTIVIPATSEVNLAETAQLAASNLATNTDQAIDIALIGEVNRPGAYKLQGGASSRPTVTQAIQTAGGITPSANLREIQIRRMTRRGSEQLISVNLWELVQSGDLSQDLILQGGDTVVIPRAEELTTAEALQLGTANIAPSAVRVSVVGEVGSPGSIEVPSNATLNQAILAAGGLNRRAQRSVKLLRLNPNGTLAEQEIEVDLTQGIDPNTNPIVRNNDIIVVGRSGLTRITDGISGLLNSVFLLNPIFRLLPF